MLRFRILVVGERFEVECLDSGPWVENLIPESRETQRLTRSQYLILRRLAAYKWVSNRVFLFQGSIFRTYVSLKRLAIANPRCYVSAASDLLQTVAEVNGAPLAFE